MSRPAQIQFLSRVARAYDPVVRLMGFARLWRAIADVAAPVSGERALDVCAGTGGVALELAQRGARVIGLDLAEGMLRQARRKSNGRAATHAVGSHAVVSHAPGDLLFLHMNARHLAFPDRSFPLVTCSMALHEMAEDERTQVLDEIARVASDRVVIAEYHVPRESVRGMMFRVTRMFEYLESDDFGRFVRRDFRERLDAASLSVHAPRDIGAYRIWSCRVNGGPTFRRGARPA